MIKKARLQGWVGKLDPSIDPAMPAAELETVIDNVIARLPRDPLNDEPECPGITDGCCPWLVDEPEYPQYTFREGLANNARVLREELPDTVKAVKRNLFG